MESEVATGELPVPDAALLVRYRAHQDRGALEELFQRHRGSLLAYCQKRTRSLAEAEELAGAAVARALEKIEQCPEDAFFPWLCRIAANHQVNDWKHWNRRRDSLGTDAEHAVPGKSVEQRAIEDEVLAWVNDLPFEERVCVKMRHLDGLEVDEICVETGWDKERVYTLLERGRAALRQRYQRGRRLNHHA